MPRRRRTDREDFLRRLLVLLGVLTGLQIAGTIGYALTTDRGVWDAFVLSIDTIATLGSIQHLEGTGAEVVKVLLVVLGVGTLYYALVSVTEFFVAGHLAEIRARRRMQKMIDALSDHLIVCGYGRVGRQVAGDLQHGGDALVVVDCDERAVRAAREDGLPAIEGRSSEDAVLREAGVERARALLACVDSDAENIFTALSARELSADVRIVARAGSQDAESKLRRAGVDHVVSPYRTSGTEMARLALHPAVAGELELAPAYRLDELAVHEEAACAGRSVGDVRGDAFVVAVRRAGGELVTQPDAGVVLEPGDVVVALGSEEAMEGLERRFEPARRRPLRSATVRPEAGA